MVKKTKKKSNNFNSSQNVSSKEENQVNEEELPMHQKSSNSMAELPPRFIIQLDHKNIYSKLLKSSHVVLLHPSIISKLLSPRYVLVKGKNSFSLCVPYPLKHVKRSSIVFRRDAKDFENEELVMLHPYTMCVLKAASVDVTLDTEVACAASLQENIKKLLRKKKYFYTGMTAEDPSFNFIITNITYKESAAICDNKSIDIRDFKNTSSFYNKNSVSFTEASSKILNACDGDKSNVLFHQSQLNSMFSSMCLSDSECQFTTEKESSDFFDQNNTSDIGAFSEINIPLFYTLTYATSITVTGSSQEVMKKYVTNFSQIGGLDDEIQFLKNFVDNFLNSKRTLQKLEFMLLLGPPGTGKTMVLDAIKNEYREYVEEVCWYKLYMKSLSDAEYELHNAFQRACNKSACVIIMDDFNHLYPKVKDLQSQRISRALSNLIETHVGENIIIVAAANNSEYNANLFEIGETRVEEIKFKIPTAAERLEILIKSLSNKHHDLTPEEIQQCVLQSQGFTGKDLNFILNEALSYRHVASCKNLSSSVSICDDLITFNDIKQALKYKKPSIVESNLKIKEVRWNDIGGMKEVKEKLKDVIEGPLKYPEIYKRFGIKASRGVLLFGPPGCSKTMIAKALATECDMNFISKNVSDIQNKYVGESEKAVHNLFLLAKEKAPCIIFLDEIDAIVAGRESGSGVEERIVNSFLQEMDGLEELRDVIIIAATNRPDRLDAAFVRNGRINHFIYVPLPDLEAREEILRLQMKKREIDADFDYKRLAIRMEGYSGAEIVNLCNEAAFQILLEDVNCESAVFTMEHFESAMKVLIPRTPLELLEFYKIYNLKFGSK